MLLHQRFSFTFSQISLAYGLKQLKLFKCFFGQNFYICPEQNLEHSYGFPVYHMSHPIDRVLYLLVHHSSLLRLSKGPWDRLFWKKYFFTVSSPLRPWIQISWHFCFLTSCSVLCINIKQREVLKKLKLSWHFNTDNCISLGDFGKCLLALEIAANSFRDCTLQSFCQSFNIGTFQLYPVLKHKPCPFPEQRES